jgi:DNA-binding transcriptional ArsR family regulator
LGPFPVTRPAVSRHLSVLLRSHLVNVRSEASRRVYSLDIATMDAVSEWLDECRASWERRIVRDGHNPRAIPN